LTRFGEMRHFVKVLPIIWLKAAIQYDVLLFRLDVY